MQPHFTYSRLAYRHFASQSSQNPSSLKNVSNLDSMVDFISYALRSMMAKDSKYSKSDIRSALKQLKELEAKSGAEVLKRLSSPVIVASSAVSPSSSLSSSNLPPSRLGPVVEEYLARLLEVGFESQRLPAVFSHLVVLYPDWRADGWENVIDRYVVNKGHTLECVAAMLVALPRDQVCNFSIRTTASDMIFAYEQGVWRKHASFEEYRMGLPTSSLWPAEYYGRILGEIAKRHPSLLDETAAVVAHMAFNVWNRALPSGAMATEYEMFVASIYFAAATLASIVHHSGKLSNGTIARFLQTFNVKCLDHLRTNADTLVRQHGFNTFEYIEWISILVAETAKRRGSSFNDIFLIKKCLDALMDKWGADDVALASASISRRFSLAQFVREMMTERNTAAKGANESSRS